MFDDLIVSIIGLQRQKLACSGGAETAPEQLIHITIGTFMLNPSKSWRNVDTCTCILNFKNIWNNLFNFLIIIDIQLQKLLRIYIYLSNLSISIFINIYIFMFLSFYLSIYISSSFLFVPFNLYIFLFFNLSFYLSIISWPTPSDWGRGAWRGTS